MPKIIAVEKVVERAEKFNIDEKGVEDALEKMKKKGDICEMRSGKISKL